MGLFLNQTECDSTQPSICDTPPRYRASRDIDLFLSAVKLAITAVVASLLCPSSGLSHGTGGRGANVLDWHSEDISRVVSSETNWNNLGVGKIFSEPGRVIEIEGKQCLVGWQFDFDVLDVLAFDTDEEIRVEIEFDLQTSSTMVGLAYDKNGGGPSVVAISLPETWNERFHTESIALDRARFAGRGNYGTDPMVFSTGGRDTSITISDVRVVRSYETELAVDHGWLNLTIQGDTGEPTPARVGLYNESGRAPLPSSAALIGNSIDPKQFEGNLRD